MDDDDDGGAWAHQMELEQRQQEEEAALNRCRRVTREFRAETKTFERDMSELNERIETNWSEINGNSG